MFDEALSLVFLLEGGKTDNKNDPGRKTNLGITQKTYTAWLLKHGKSDNDVFNITEEEAKEIYYNEYWLPAGCDKLPIKLALCHFQSVVLLWIVTSNKILADVMSLQNKRKSLLDESLCFIYLTLQYIELKDRIQKNPALEIFHLGWINRLSKTFKFISNLK